MQIFIKIREGTSISFDAEPNSSILDIKMAIEERLKISISKQCLVLSKKITYDWQLLKNYSTESALTFQLILLFGPTEVRPKPVPIIDDIQEIIKDESIPEKTREIIDEIGKTIKNSNIIKTDKIRIDTENIKKESVKPKPNANSNNYTYYKAPQIPPTSKIVDEFPTSFQSNKYKFEPPKLTTKDDMMLYTRNEDNAKKLSDFQNVILNDYINNEKNNPKLWVRNEKSAAQIIKDRQQKRIKK